MALLSKKELKLIEFLINSKESQTKKLMSLYLRNHYNQADILETKDYIIAKGDIPVALVAHMDTVWEDFKGNKKHLYHDRLKGVLWCPEGAGFDDKIGLFLIYKILESGRKPHIVLTTGEEIGGVGAYALAAEGACPFTDLKYCIELDRRGSDDCVFYSCDNHSFTNYVETFGFKTNIGTFSDICYLCQAWGVAGVNLSVGYIDEHTNLERVYIRMMLKTLSRVKKMLDEVDIPFFEYVDSYYGKYGGYYDRSYYWYGYDDDEDYYYDHYTSTKSSPLTKHACCKCGLKYSAQNLMPVQDVDGKYINFCIHCLDDDLGWCDYCHEPFILADKETWDYVCPQCNIKYGDDDGSKNTNNLQLPRKPYQYD